MWSPKEGWEVAQSHNISLLGIANKVEFNHPNASWIPILRDLIDSSGIPSILLGVELDIGDPNGKNVLPLDTLKYLDYIIAAPHNQPVYSLLWEDMEEDEIEEYFSSYKSILINSFSDRSLPFTIWAHPFLQELEFTASHYEPYLTEIFDKMLDLCIERNIAIEINENYFRFNSPNRIPKEALRWYENPSHFIKEKMRMLKMFFTQAKKAGLLFTFASDSHKLEDVGNFPQSILFAKDLHLTTEQFLKLHPR